MSSGVWTWFKRLGHWLAVGAKDAEKFIAAIQQSGLISLIPGGPVVGILEKIFAYNMAVEKISATLAQSGTTLTSQQKLNLATPDALAALVNYAQSGGFKITDIAKAEQIAAGVASLGADFLNILDPASGAKLPVPNTPAAPAVPTPPATTQPPTPA